QEEPRAVRDAHAQAAPRHRRSDAADRRRADEARPRRRRRRRDQAVKAETTMRSGVIAQKVGMTRVFTDAGEQVGVTVLKLDKEKVAAQRTAEKNGYTAVQLGAGSRKVKNTPKALRGHFARAEVEPKRELAEFRVSPENLIAVGSELTADHF